MLPKLLLSTSQKLAERVLGAVTLPALGFWLVGVIILRFSPEYSRLVVRIKLADHIELGLLLATVFTTMVVSAGLVSYVTPELLKFMLGDWPGWLHSPNTWLANLKRLENARQRRALQSLAVKIEREGWEGLSAPEIRSYAALERSMRRWPSDQRQIMPTALGNVLRAAESRPANKYGLEPAVVWPRLQLVAAKDAISLLDGTQSEFQAVGRLATWSVLLPVWVVLGFVCGIQTPRLYWVLALFPTAGGLFLIAYRRSIDILEGFCDTFEAVFDLYRTNLYSALRWPLPIFASEEQSRGRSLTAYLLRGSSDPSLRYESTIPAVGNSRTGVAEIAEVKSLDGSRASAAQNIGQQALETSAEDSSE